MTLTKWFCVICMVDGKDYMFELDVPKGAEFPKCPVHEDEGLVECAEPCCTVEGRELLRDDMGQYDDTGDACGPSWICTGCKKRTTW